MITFFIIVQRSWWCKLNKQTPISVFKQYSIQIIRQSKMTIYRLLQLLQNYFNKSVGTSCIYVRIKLYFEYIARILCILKTFKKCLSTYSSTVCNTHTHTHSYTHGKRPYVIFNEYLAILSSNRCRSLRVTGSFGGGKSCRTCRFIFQINQI